MSVLSTLEGWGVVGGTLLGAATLVWQMLSRYRDRAEQERRDLAERDGRQFSAGAASRNDEVALLRSQRDDARLERDEARRQTAEAKAAADRWQQAYIEMTRRRGG